MCLCLVSTLQSTFSDAIRFDSRFVSFRFTHRRQVIVIVIYHIISSLTFTHQRGKSRDQDEARRKKMVSLGIGLGGEIGTGPGDGLFTAGPIRDRDSKVLGPRGQARGVQRSIEQKRKGASPRG